MSADQSDVSITMTYDEAFVLFELLHRWEDEARVSEPEHEAERVALAAISCLLEPKIVEVFDDDYDVSLNAARERLVEGYDDPPPDLDAAVGT